MKAKGGTQSDVRKHTFVPFTERVAAIRIDPVRKVSGHHKLPEQDQESYFIEALRQWNELNLATNFTTFAEKVEPLALSLPMIIHNQQQIVDLLLAHARLIDAHSAEPILDLITHFAHDMGPDFEPYFGKTLTTLIEIAENMHGEPDLELYERVFNCLAYLFKYLARLLTTDLRPTYDLIATLFGKDHKQRGFVLKFAAESMAFLVRKCTGPSLSLIVDHIVQDVDRQQSSQYSKSTSILLANTMKGPGNGLHSRTSELASTLFAAAANVGTPSCYNFVCDVFTQVLHHVRKESSQPLYDALLSFEFTDKEFEFLLLYTFAGLRKGDRVRDWAPLYQRLVALATQSPELSLNGVLATAVIVANASFEATSQYFVQLSSALSHLPSALMVYTLLSKLNTDATKTFVEKIILPRLVANNVLSEKLGLFLLELDTKVPKATKFDAKDLLNLWWKIHVVEDSFAGVLKKAVKTKVKDNLRGLQADICGTLLLADPSTANFDLVIENFSHLESRPSLLKGLVLAMPETLSIERKKEIVELILPSTMSWNMPIRSAAVTFCQKLFPHDILNSCIMIDQIPLDVSNARNLAMHIRNLAKSYSTSGSNYIVDLVVPRFMFGLLTSRFQPVWTAVLEQVSVLADKNKDIIWELAIKWIQETPQQVKLLDEIMEPELPPVHTLDCTYLAEVQQLGRHVWADFDEPDVALKLRAAEQVDITVPDDLRSLAIKVLAQVPKVAEVHGDDLTPFLLHDAGEETAYKDRIALLELFSKFTKPRKLERFDEIYARYLYFLGSRHLPIQKLAIKCVLSDNSAEAAVLRKYRDNLDALTDEQRMKDEMTHIVSYKGSGREHAIHDDDREIVMPIVVRVLYGRAQIAKASGGIRAGQRHAVLSAIHSLEPVYLKLFNQLAVEQVEFNADISSLRRMIGYLSLVQDSIQELQSLMVHALDVVVPALLRIVKVVEQINAEEEVAVKSARQLRQMSTKTLESLFSSVADQSLWANFIDDIYSVLISPQLVNFGQRNLEQPSALMVLFLTLSSDIGLVGYLRPEIVEALVSCITFENVKEPVVQLVLGFVENLVDANSQLAHVAVPTVVEQMPQLLDREFSIPALSQQVSLLNKLVDHNVGLFTAESRDKLISVALLALNKPTGKVPTAVKANLLDSLSKLLVDPSVDESKIDEAYVNLAKMFRLFSDRRARENLARCYASFGTRCPKYRLVGELVVELNSYDQRRLGLPDFDRRLAAFAIINEEKYLELSAIEWLVVLYNMLFFIKDPEELALRNNAAFSLRRFVTAVNEAGSSDFVALLDDVVMPAIKLGLRENTETFRLLYLEVFSHLVHTNTCVDSLQDLKSLYSDEDDEVDFFYNIHHIQVHRRRKAVQQLAAVAREEKLTGNSISQYLLPIIEHFVAYSGSKDGELNNLADDALVTIGELTKHITWNQFRAIVRRYVSLVCTRPLEIKKNVKLVNAMGIAIESPQFELPKPEKYAAFVSDEVVAPLHKVLSKKTNEHENLPERITLAVPIIYFLRSLPKDDLELQLPGKLSGLCQILRSKTQELRDAVRETLAKVVKILGPQYFVYVVSELRSALRRGAQLHVLGFTVHSLLLELKDVLAPGDLDASVEIISDIVMEDTFGATGQEKESDGYVTSAKEVKQHKSFDTAEILATNISIPQYGLLVQPIKDLLLYTKLNIKTERKVSELLQRISSGLHRNPVSKSQQGLVMCFQMFKMCTSTLERQQRDTEAEDQLSLTDRKSVLDRAAKESEDFFKVRLSSRHWDDTVGPRKVYATQLHLLQTFVLDALRTMLGAGELLTVANIKGLLPIIEEGIQSTHEDTQIAALKLAAFSLRIPVPGIDDRITTLGRRTLALIKSTSSTTTELCQACLKFLIMLFKHKPEFQLKESGVGYILDRIKPDIEEPDRQGVSIGFTRAVLSRKLLLPQLYDMMDQIAKVMVTNQSAMVRTACRSAYLQFLLEYPHGKQRLDKHFAFLVSNLQYPSSNGRLSVMEMIRLVVTKVHEDQIEASLTSFFVGLVLVLVNDDDAECRSTASALIKDLLARADSESKQVMIDFCISWLSKLGSNNLLVRGGLEVVAMMNEVGGYLNDAKLVARVDKTVIEVLEGSRRQSGLDVDWQLVYFVLQYVSRQKIDLDMLRLVEETLLFPHPWVRALAGRIFGNYYTLAKTKGATLPIDFVTEAANKFMRQMGAPSLPEPDGVQIVKNLVFTVGVWEATSPAPTVSTKTGEQQCVEWLVHRVSGLLRVDIHDSETVGSKRSAVQLLASLAQVLDAERLKSLAADSILGLYVLTDQLDESKSELRDLAQQALSIYDKTLGTTDYLQLYNDARQQVQAKRMERRAKRSVEAVTAPAAHARKKIRKNMLKKESRRRTKRT